MCWDVGSNGRGPLDAGADSEVRVHLLTEICEGTPSMDSSVDELYLLVACVYLTYTMQVTTFPTELSYKHMCYTLNSDDGAKERELYIQMQSLVMS